MGLFRKTPTFKTTDIGLGTARGVYVKPTKKELAQIQGAGRISLTPHGSAVRKIKVAPRKRRRAFEGAGEIASEFRSWEGKSAADWTSGFGSGYDSKSALDRNLGL